MDYAAIYEDLIAKRRRDALDKAQGYCERHHYIPKCLGGGDESWNIVNLTAKEHFVAHHLLHKIYPKDGKLLNAFVAMCTKTTRQKRSLYISARRYEELKRQYGEYLRQQTALMSDEDRQKRIERIKAGCARRTPEQKAKIKAKRIKYFESLTDADKAIINAKRQATIAARSESRKREIAETISRAHRKMSGELEQRVVNEYLSGKTALEISQEPWCELGREGVNYLLRRNKVEVAWKRRWAGKSKHICDDFENGTYPTRDALAKAYGTSWCTIRRILEENNVKVVINDNRKMARQKLEMEKLRNEYVSYHAPFSKRCVAKISLYNAIGDLRMWGIIPGKMTHRAALKKIRNALGGRTKYAFGYKWASVWRGGLTPLQRKG